MTERARLQDLIDMHEEAKARMERLRRELKGIERGIAEPKTVRKKAPKERRGAVK